MPQELIATNPTTLEEFLSIMEKVESQNLGASFAQPATIRLHGNKNEWLERFYNEKEKRSEEKPFKDFSDGSFIVTPLAVKYYAKWEFDQNNKKTSFKTREFSNFTVEPIELLEIHFTPEKTTAERKAMYTSYQEFKAEHAQVDKITGKTKSPYDLYVAVYAYHWDQRRVVKICMKGASRGAWFDFPNSAKSEAVVRSITQLKVRFGSEVGGQMKDDNDGKMKDFFKATLGINSVNSLEEMTTIMNTTLALSEWMKSWDRKNEEDTGNTNTLAIHADETATEPMPKRTATEAIVDHGMIGAGEEIRLEDIPF